MGPNRPLWAISYVALYIFDIFVIVTAQLLCACVLLFASKSSKTAGLHALFYKTDCAFHYIICVYIMYLTYSLWYLYKYSIYSVN